MSIRIIVLALFARALIGAPASASERTLPNIIFILADDMGYGDLGCYGAKGGHTPHFDRMANEGVRFTDFYVAQSICSASRAGLLTGCYPNRVGILGALDPGCKGGIGKGEKTIADVLKTRGYATALYGKWHLGDRAEFLPTRHGFDDYFGIPYSNDMGPRHPRKNGGSPCPPLMRGERIIEPHVDQAQLTTRYTERAIAFIEKNKDRPFFLYLAHAMPHVPLHVSNRHKGKSKLGLYGDVIMELDWSVGQVLAALKQHNLDSDTLVLFASDNGPWLSHGDHGGKAGPLRGGKATTWEGGVRVPFIARWPNRIPAGTVQREPAMAIDILPTLAALTGATLPEHKIDGKNIWPLLSGQPGAKSPHEALYFFLGRKLQALRSGKWKLRLSGGHRNPASNPGGADDLSARMGPMKTCVALYDLEKDLGEKVNLAEANPDVVTRLQKLADDARKDLGDSATQTKGNGVRASGEDLNLSSCFVDDDESTLKSLIFAIAWIVLVVFGGFGLVAFLMIPRRHHRGNRSRHSRLHAD